MIRWTRFASVGVLGFVVQVAMLQLLTAAFEVHYLVAVVVAVEAAILHNFVWHERWTWRDRIGDSRTAATLGRLARFNAASGTISLVGNAVFTALFVAGVGLPVMMANVAAIVCLTALNFVAADRFAFGDGRRDASAPMFRARSAVRRIAAASVCLLTLTSQPAHGAELKPETIAAWERYVGEVEARLARETRDTNRFLASDFSASHAGARSQVVRGEILVDNVAGGTVNLGAGTISHWRGQVFVPGVTIDELLDGATLRGLATPKLAPGSTRATAGAQHRQEDVLDARVLARNGDSLRLFLKLQRKAIVTVAYNTEHLVSYRRLGAQRATSRSISTRIAELRDPGTPHESEKPIGQDRGFIWRLHSYWKYHAVAGGVVVELESLTLSRDVPWAVRAVAAPLIDRIARESMTRALASLRARYSSSSAGSRAPDKSGIAEVSDSASNPALA